MRFFSFFKRHTSGTIAKDRLKILLISDRTNCSQETLELIKNDIIAVISKYMMIDAKSTEIQITQSKRSGSFTPSLSANIPILDLKKH